MHCKQKIQAKYDCCFVFHIILPLTQQISSSDSLNNLACFNIFVASIDVALLGATREVPTAMNTEAVFLFEKLVH
jgi:hypothetical protein